MTVYTEQTLKEINSSYDLKNKLTTTDIKKVNDWVKFIEEGRKDKKPQVGDIVEFTNKYGDYYADAHIDEVDKEEVNICTRSPLAFALVTKSEEGSLATYVGGPSQTGWWSIPKNLKLIGKRKKLFATLIDCELAGEEMINFLAEVNVWEYQEEDLQYTTKTHDRFKVRINEGTKNNGYKYIVYKDNLKHTAMKTDEEYKAWLDASRSVEFNIRGFYSKIVWTLKQEGCCVPHTNACKNNI
ncbi:DUF4121 family protein [Priestia filamentosa]|uniref:DUF4121 family protein n=1 Tax=Priestia filamentosa TaxID=1402861 RepID=UPI0039823AF9